MREIVLDTETTGLNYRMGDRVVEVGCVELINHVSTKNNLQFYCSTNRVIADEAAKVHGLTNAFLNQHPPFKDQVKKFLEFIGNDPLIIHNAEFDVGFINNELKLLGVEPLKNKIIDTVSLARKTLNTRIANLDYLCRRFQIDLSGRDLHGALLDSQLLADVYLELIGGKQISMNLNLKKEAKNVASKNNVEKPRFVSKVVLTDKDILLHKNLVSGINNSLWKKFDY
ncbi:DNA polymerase III subunit epsilon [Alphaproteobacteria bacterium]|nr:DNA polymerase III subunit epsilon [Alphaproteobacteria bacterium]